MNLWPYNGQLITDETDARKGGACFALLAGVRLCQKTQREEAGSGSWAKVCPGEPGDFNTAYQESVKLETIID